jgi:hypothetical protein
VVVPLAVAQALLQGKPSGLVAVSDLPAFSQTVTPPSVFMYTPGTSEEPWGFLEATEAGEVLHRLNVRPQRLL